MKNEEGKVIHTAKEGMMVRRNVRALVFVFMVLMVGSVITGCANLEYKPWWFYVPRELPDADRAIDEARQAGKDSECPDRFADATNMRDSAYEIYRQCYTDKAIEMAREAKEIADNLCPDSDGDGVPDSRDKCPDTPAGAPVDSTGCPLDSDGDGVPDFKDKCPDTPAGAPVDSTGCPLDSDGDGVPDFMDKCPDTPAGINVDSTGCPVPIEEKVSIDLRIEFDLDKDAIKPVYRDHLEQVANFLKAYPDTVAVVEGHTDSSGSEAYNLRLSERRASSVIRYLAENFGIDQSRLSAKGYGESTPVADNTTEEGRQQNRRAIAVISTIVTK